ncbi:2,4-dienoyl-CoA reductase [Enterococcus malodoratus]|uniref:bile acid Fe-S flavoenzyme BaiCD n=1 Tax=Enterococcus malodoratus TaxID=71451 RepID=UPI0008C71183|nr:FAD-dependent oxidoreductase [Enterococcus malodoratus]SET44016.1 2,4-dienoyl-CoA reductase [Enterococcus malodoratus]
MFPTLFSPITIRQMTLKNRAIMPAMGTQFPKDNQVTQQLIDYHVARAKGGSALNIVEVTGVHAGSIPSHYLSLAEDRFIPGMQKLTAAIHEHGGKAGVQLWQGSIAVASDPTVQVIVASDMPVSPEYTIPGASKELIAELIVCFKEAARRAVEADFDCIEVHLAHNYILHSFLSGGINRRTDEYGGSLENRARFPLAVIEAMRSAMPDTMPLFMRIDAHDDYLENGLTIEEVIQFVKWAKDLGVDVVDVSRGNIISSGLKYEVPPIDIPFAFNIENAARIKAETGIITMGVGRVNYPALAEEILAEDKVDLIGLGRAQLSDPDFLTKAAAGKLEDIVYCVGCNQGCYDACERPDIPHITCLRNPACGKEREYELVPTTEPKKIVVAGGGMAGMEVAMTLQERGFQVILCEASDRLGGQFLLAGMAPRKQEMRQAAILKGEQIQRAGVEVRLNTPVTETLLKELNPEVVINAVGAQPLQPRIPGIEKDHVYTYVDILQNKPQLAGKTVVIGGGLVGLEVAETIAETGGEVTVIEMTDAVAKDLGSTRKITVMEQLYADNVTTMTETTCISITDQGVQVRKDGVETLLACDHVVAAIGSQSRDFKEIEAYCEAQGLDYYVIGDALEPRRALEATAEGAALARSI